MKKQLNTYLNTAKSELNTKPLIDESSVRNILLSSDEGKAVSNYKFSNNYGVLKMVAIGSLIISLMMYFLFFLPAGNEKLPSAVHSENPTENSKTEITTDTTITTQETENNEKQEETDYSNKYILELILSKKGSTVNIPLILLKDEELNDIDVQIKNGLVEFTTESTYNQSANYEMKNQLISNNYPTQGIMRTKQNMTSTGLISSIIPYENWNMDTSSGIHPVFVQTFITDSIKNTVNYASSIFNSPQVNPIYEDYVREELMRINQTFVTFNWDAFMGENMYHPLQLEVQKINYDFVKDLLIVLVDKEFEGKKISTFLWYLPTPTLLQKIPQRLKSFVSYFEKIEYLDLAQDVKLKNLVYPSKDIKESINGIENIELTIDEIQKLGIRYDSGKFYTYFQGYFNVKEHLDANKNDTTSNIKLFYNEEEFQGYKQSLKKKFTNMGLGDEFNEGILRNEIVIDTTSIIGNEINYTGWSLKEPSKLLPIAVSVEKRYCKYNERKGRHFSFTDNTVRFSESPLLETDEDGFFTRSKDGKVTSKTDLLLPITIYEGTREHKDSSKINYLIIKFWFLINKEVAELLPDRYKNTILSELLLMEKISEGKLMKSEACDELMGEKSYFDICSSGSAENIDFNIFPNPSDGNNFTISFTATEALTLSIDLYDVTGNFLANLKKEIISQTGKVDIQVNLKDKLPAGVYLINLNDGRNIQSIKKLIIKD